MRRLLGREVLLGRVAGPFAHEDAIGPLPGESHRGVGAPGVDDDDVVGPRHRIEGGEDVRRLVARDDGDRQLRHTGEYSASYCP